MTAAYCGDCGLWERALTGGGKCLATGKPRDAQDPQCTDGDAERRAKAVARLTGAMGRGRKPKTGRR